MSVYVDDMRAPFGRLVLCHMVADTLDELNAMADRIGVARKWIQHADDPIAVHYDIALSKRVLAIAAGAQDVSMRFLGERQMNLRRAAKGLPPTTLDAIAPPSSTPSPTPAGEVDDGD